MKCVKTNYLDYEWKSSHSPSQTLTNMFSSELVHSDTVGLSTSAFTI